MPMAGDYFLSRVSNDIFGKLHRCNVSQSRVSCELTQVPAPFISQWVNDCAGLSHRNEHDWDRECPNVQFIRKEQEKCWLLTTWAACEGICGFDEYVEAPEGERAFKNARQRTGGDVVFVVPPVLVKWTTKPVKNGYTLDKLSVTVTTAVVPFCEGTFLRLSAAHPIHTGDTLASKDFWPHLPMYSDYTMYLNVKSSRAILDRCSKEQPRSQQLMSRTKNVLSRAAKKWAGKLPKLVPRRAKEYPGAAQPYQHPKLTAARAGYRTWAQRTADMDSANKRKEAAEVRAEERRAKIARAQYQEGKELALRIMQGPSWTAEKRQAAMLRDPRFNGENDRLGYDGVGTPPQKRALALASKQRMEDLGFVAYLKPPSFPHLNPADNTSEDRGDSETEEGGSEEQEWENPDEGDESEDVEDEYSEEDSDASAGDS